MVTGFRHVVTIAIGDNPVGGTLTGVTKVKPVAGVATFEDLSINRPGVGYTLVASAAQAASVTSDLFDIEPVPVASVEVNPASATVVVGGTVQLEAIPRDSVGTPLVGLDVIWSSVAPAVATVSSGGLVTGVAEGDATITALVEGETGTSSITVVAAPVGGGNVYYVSPLGATGGDGSFASPWDLGTALEGGNGIVQPGDTVWVRGGNYVGDFVTNLQGQAGAEITFRQYPGERATIDGQLQAGSSGNHLIFWGLEVMQSNGLHASLGGKPALYIRASNSRFINMVVHDAGTQGISFYVPAINSEVYGCISYNNGQEDNLDHGIYVHETDKRVEDCVLFNNMANGIHAYETNPQRNVVIEGNISFNNGSIDPQAQPNGSNLLVRAKKGGSSGVQVLDNMLYFTREDDGENLRVGDQRRFNNQDIVVQGNYVKGGKAVLFIYEWEQLTVSDNVLIGLNSPEIVFWEARGAGTVWTNNSWHHDPTDAAWSFGNLALDFAAWRAASGAGASDQASALLPPAPQIFVRPNKYEPGRAHIAVYNWTQQGSVPVDLSGVLGIGDEYELRNVQDVFGAPVLSGTYQGGVVNLPMSGVAPPVPLGRSTATPPRTGPEFDAFLLTLVPTP